MLIDDHPGPRNLGLGDVIEVVEVPAPEGVPVDWPEAEPAVVDPELEPAPA